jgi:hypothetical protein
MITTKTTTAMVAAIALLGAVAPAAFAQVTQTNTNTNTQTSTVTTGAISSGFLGTTSVSIGVSQEAGACQLGLGADNDVNEAGAGDASSETEITGSIVESDCS